MMMAVLPDQWWMKDGKKPTSVFAEHLAGSEFGVFVAIISVLTMISMASPVFSHPPLLVRHGEG